MTKAASGKSGDQKKSDQVRGLSILSLAVTITLKGNDAGVGVVYSILLKITLYWKPRG